MNNVQAVSINSIMTVVRCWWLSRVEAHYLICAEVETQRVRDASLNISYYQKRAAMVRIERIAQPIN